MAGPEPRPRPLHRFFVDGKLQQGELHYDDLWRRSEQLARALRERLQPGSQVLLLHGFGPSFPVAFMACLRAELVAVPAYPPDPGRPNQNLDRIATIVRDSQPSLILTDENEVRSAELARSCATHPLEIATLEALAEHGRALDNTPLPPPNPEAVAFVQYTSGTTRRPRGARITHENLIAHQRHAHPTFRCPEASLTVSWLPFYHDMGLIGPVLYPLYCGGTTMFMPPMSFLRRPMSWLRAISDHGAGISTAPNFAYEICAQKATDADVASLDLSSWFLTVCGAEPLNPRTLSRFSERFGPSGFRPETFMPCYGLAEATLMVSGADLESPPVERSFETDALRRGRAVESKAEGHTRMIACGRVMQAHEVRILEPNSAQILAEGVCGEVCIAGPSVCGGYECPQPEDDDRWLEFDEPSKVRLFRTGDRGFLWQQQLYVLGRLADELELGEQIFQAHELEDVVAEALGRFTRAAPVVVDCEGLRVFVEARRSHTADALAEQGRKLYAAVRSACNIELASVEFVAARQIEKTTSGKARRFAYREAWQRAELEGYLSYTESDDSSDLPELG